MKSVPRWLTSITDMPLPRQSSSSACARRNTGSGNIAGPGLKLYTRFIARVSVPYSGVAGLVAHRLDTGNTDEPIAVVQANQPHTLGIAAHRRNVGDRRANHGARRSDEHQLVLRRDLQRADEAAIALRCLNADDALAAAALHRMLVDGRQLAVAVLRGRHDRSCADDAERDDFLGRAGQLESADAGGRAAHRAHVLLGEANRFAGAARTT